MSTAASSQPLTPPPAELVDLWPATAMKPLKAEWQRLRCRFINADPVGHWDEFVLSEWELTSCGWEDFHPHTETNYVLEGELHVKSEGKTVILKPGDVARVNRGQLGTYWAPVYARMVTVYGPNPHGVDSHSFRYFELGS